MFRSASNYCMEYKKKGGKCSLLSELPSGIIFGKGQMSQGHIPAPDRMS